MKKLFTTLALLLTLGVGAYAQAVAPAPRLVVRLNDDLAPATGAARPVAATAKEQAFEQLNRRHGAMQVQVLNPGRPQNRGAAVAAPAMYLITLPAGTDVQQAVKDYEQTGLFRYVELDAAGQGGGVQSFVPNDALYNRQWGLKNTGSFTLSAARAGADISMEDGWAITRGDSSVTVAIIDSGCKLDHPELDRRIWRNRREIPGNNIDDDQNGYIDDVQGWNFVSNTSNPTDDQGHGTNIAGIIGASGNNSLGYAGVNWGCKLMVCKALDSQNNGFYSWWTSSIFYAVNNGARVINMSMGGISFSQAMQDAIAFANQQGVVVVACTMNTNSSTSYYPAAMTGVIAVGSTNPDDARTSPFFWSTTSGSNYGAHISVVAPGNYIYGLSHTSNTNYNSYWGGTSQATPHVVGLASLLLTIRPQLTPAQVKSTLQSTADDQIGQPSEDVAGWDQYYGFGRVNAARALASVVTSAATPRVPASALQLFPNPASHHLTLKTTDSRLLNQEVRLFNSIGQVVYRRILAAPTLQLPLALPPGTYWLAVAGTGRKLVIE
ncbi:S8 family serine peptidase [Hymenobacter arizonensis]|uniref:Por secretion system C-terminal sorting domain-containing protein n=1 Tax=Hymenobacter arizonensis TaxID=1227077 RepID=A0A1I5Y985_HYMAR|nr:S8 family serine peptidase [Hymenobacter arizonensis]SFQ40766.1 Por secretion system C-terminal sorting domain-containing protein [Hymenobacter arizonensis]